MVWGEGRTMVVRPPREEGGTTLGMRDLIPAW
jgi:hypothetical protein